MYSRTATRTLACRRLLSTTKSTGTKRCIPAITQSPSFLYTALHSTPRPQVFQCTTPSSQLRHYAASAGVEEDPEREGLYYHQISDDVFALSFLDEKPASQNSATVIGFVKGGDKMNSFQENRELHLFCYMEINNKSHTRL
jgi:hypothetical protein